jgi:hypothetical protein
MHCSAHGGQLSREAIGSQTAGRLSRRVVLRAAGASVALPLLDAMVPVFGRAARAAAGVQAKRMVAVHLPLGMMPMFFFPAKPKPAANQSAANQPAAPSSPYLELLANLRGQFTAFSGLSHPGVGGGHAANVAFLTGAPGTGQPSFRNTQSLDQFVADRIGAATRFPSLVLGVQKRPTSDGALAVAISRSGVPIPTEQSPQRLFRAMFVAGTADEQAETMRRIQAGGSVLDALEGRATALARDVDAADRERLDQYFTSVRELEQKLTRAVEWQNTPKPTVDYPEPNDITDANFVIEKSQLMFDLIRLALQTDSTRVITLHISTFNTIAHVPGVKEDTHSLSHHSNEEHKIVELRKVEEAQVRTLGRFLESLREAREAEGTLLDHTQVLYGSCLGNASNHTNHNLPILLAGGGYRHPGHLSFDEKANAPLANLFVTMLQRMGLEADSFASSTGTLRGLEV